MAELRWALLLAGLLFVAGLVWWEMRKRRARDAGRPGGSSGAASQAMAPGATHERAGAVPAAAEPGLREEPSFSMPDLPRREPVRDLPVVEIDPRAADGPRVGELPVIEMDEPRRAPSPAAGSDAPQLPVEEVSAPREIQPADPVEKASAWLADSIPGEAPQTVVVDWPPEDQRRIMSLRVMPRQGERFTGASLRQALVGEGFIHGDLDIYHKPAGDGRALISAASLTRPGTFDPRTIDSLLFAGLNLFAVLPGPLPPRETLERLLLVARTLAQRLRGEALDGRGQPLTDGRVAELRREANEGIP